MVQYGMPHHGQQKMGSTRLITDTNLLLQSTQTSGLVVAQPIPLVGAAQSQPRHIAPVA